MKPVPVIVTAVPPESGPELGDIEVTVGPVETEGLTSMKLSTERVPGGFGSVVAVPALTSNLTLLNRTPLLPFQSVHAS